MSIGTAIKCFEENAQLIIPSSDPVAWNMNNGLLALARAVQHLQNDANNKHRGLEQAIRNIESQTRR